MIRIVCHHYGFQKSSNSFCARGSTHFPLRIYAPDVSLHKSSARKQFEIYLNTVIVPLSPCFDRRPTKERETYHAFRAITSERNNTENKILIKIWAIHQRCIATRGISCCWETSSKLLKLKIHLLFYLVMIFFSEIFVFRYDIHFSSGRHVSCYACNSCQMGSTL